MGHRCLINKIILTYKLWLHRKDFNSAILQTSNLFCGRSRFTECGTTNAASAIDLFTSVSPSHTYSIQQDSDRMLFGPISSIRNKRKYRFKTFRPKIYIGRFLRKRETPYWPASGRMFACLADSLQHVPPTATGFRNTDNSTDEPNIRKTRKRFQVPTVRKCGRHKTQCSHNKNF
jgi:hypothetical protein